MVQSTQCLVKILPVFNLVINYAITGLLSETITWYYVHKIGQSSHQLRRRLFQKWRSLTTSLHFLHCRERDNQQKGAGTRKKAEWYIGLLFDFGKIFQTFWKNVFSYFHNFENPKSKKMQIFLLLSKFSSLLILRQCLVNSQWQQMKKIWQNMSNYLIPKFTYSVNWKGEYSEKLIQNCTFLGLNQFSI